MKEWKLAKSSRLQTVSGFSQESPLRTYAPSFPFCNVSEVSSSTKDHKRDLDIGYQVIFLGFRDSPVMLADIWPIPNRHGTGSEVSEPEAWRASVAPRRHLAWRHLPDVTEFCSVLKSGTSFSWYSHSMLRLCCSACTGASLMLLSRTVSHRLCSGGIRQPNPRLGGP